MSWYERMNTAIDYIEANICSGIDFDEVAKIIGQSSVNFQRAFSIVTDISVFEYIRRRRMTLAAFDMQNTEDKVIDVALKYGYESPEAFTRAFKENARYIADGCEEARICIKDVSAHHFSTIDQRS